MAKKKTQPTTAQPKYSPKPQERAAIEKAIETRKLPPAPRLKLENRRILIDHPDQVVGQLLLQNALGTLDSYFANGLLEQLARAIQRQGKVDELDLNFVLSFIKGIEPRDQIESTLAAQMAAIHMEMMRFAARLGRIETIAQQDSAMRAFNQLARTFAAQLEALKRYRTGGEQKVTVQHVSVGEGGQAIVGNVTQGPREAAPDGTATPPLTLTKTEAAPMPIIEGKMQTPVQTARTSKKKS